MECLGKWNIPVFLCLFLFVPTPLNVFLVFYRRTAFRVEEDGKRRHKKSRGLSHFSMGKKKGKKRIDEKEYGGIKESKFTLQNPIILHLKFFSSLTSELVSSGYPACSRDDASVNKLDRL